MALRSLRWKFNPLIRHAPAESSSIARELSLWGDVASRSPQCMPEDLQLGDGATHNQQLGAQLQGLNSLSIQPWASFAQHHPRCFSTDVTVTLNNLRDNKNATKERIRVGRGNSGRRGNYCGRGMNGHNARSGGGPHLLYDGGQLGLLKFPVTRERPPYEVMYSQLGLSKLLEYVQLGLLKTDKVITMKDLQDVGCMGRIKYGVLLYGKVPLHFPIHIQVTACDPETKQIIEAAGGSVTRVYYEAEGLKALLHPQAHIRKKLPLPLPAHSWHPRYNGKFDSIGQLPPVTSLPSSGNGPRAIQASSSSGP